jgi:hypothetical protein
MKKPKDTRSQDHLVKIGTITKALESIGFQPILIGGMALVILGSRRVTRDFDFVIADPMSRLKDVVDIFYDEGMELAARLDERGDVTATIDNRKVAEIRLRLDAPSSAYFLHAQTGLRIDLLFDFPISAAELSQEAEKIKIRSHTLRVASESHLMRLKEIAKSSRSKSGDAEDILFLQSLRKTRT